MEYFISELLVFGKLFLLSFALLLVVIPALVFCGVLPDEDMR